MKLFETRTTPGGRTRGYVCGIKVFSFRTRPRIDLTDFNLQVGRDQLAAYNEIFNDDWHPEMKPGMIGAVFILTSRYMSVLKAAFDQPNVYFHVLEIPYEYMSIPFVKELLLKNRNRIGHVFDNDPRSYEAFFKVNASDYDLKFEEIREYVASHYKAQRMLMRHVYDMNEADYRFIHSLRFWLGVFARHKIAVVFSDRVEHGDCGDSLVYEVAVRHNVPVFLCAAEYVNATNLACSLGRVDRNGYHACDMRDVFGGKHSIDMTQFVHNPAAANVQAFSRGRMLEASMRKTGRGLRKSANEFERRRRQASARQLFVADTAYFSSWGTRSPRDTYSEWSHLLELKHAYEAVAVRPHEGEKYVFYALHLEPEASINNRGLISNQLWIIKALAESLPEGWKLYVKEHPVQFSLADCSNVGFFHLSHNVEWFRSKQFYAEILRNPNTSLISIDEPSEPLIRNSQAVATICGTVALESIVRKKPLLVFSDETSVVSRTKGVFRIHATSEIGIALKEIQSGFQPSYEDFGEVANSYLTEIGNYSQTEVDNVESDKFGRIIAWTLRGALSKNHNE